MSKDPEELPDLEELEPLEEPKALPDLVELEPMDAPEPMSLSSEPKPAPAPEEEPEPAPPEPQAEAPPAPAAAAIVEVTPQEEAPEAEAAPAAPAAGSGPPPPGREPQRPTRQPGEKRKLEASPLLLRKAAFVVGFGALFPFYSALDQTVGIEAAPVFGSKAIILVAAVLFHQGYMATHGGKAHDLVVKLAAANKLLPSLLAGLIMIAGCAFAASGTSVFPPIAEAFTLILAAATFSHIWGYEHGGKFNPLYPFMFAGPAIAGFLNVIGAAGAFKVENHPGNPAVGLLGSLIVAAGGILAMYTMVVAVKQAKIEGDIKKEQMREYRKAQREAQKVARSKAE